MESLDTALLEADPLWYAMAYQKPVAAAQCVEGLAQTTRAAADDRMWET